jgi:hypothetical protein
MPLLRLRSYNLLLQMLLVGQSRHAVLMAEESHSVNITGLSFPIQAQLPTNSLLTAKPRTSVSTVQFELSGMSTHSDFSFDFRSSVAVYFLTRKSSIFKAA